MVVESNERDPFDVIVIGAGMAGLVASRDLSRAGLSVVLLEARDRIGGRTYVAEALGEKLDLGGAYVHWTQPNVWYELQRHGISIQPSSPVEKCYWLAEGEVHTGTREEYSDHAHPLLVRLFADAKAWFPRPFDSEAADTQSIERESIEDRIDSLHVSPYERDVLESALAGVVHSYKDQGIAHLLHAVAGYFGDYKAFHETAGMWDIEGGTARLLDAVLSDSNASIQLSSPVESINDEGTRIRVKTTTGKTFLARSVVVAVPLSTIGDLHITPDLPSGARSMISQKNPVLAAKFWIRIKGEQSFCAYAPAGKNALNAIRTVRHAHGTTLLMAMCSNASLIPLKDANKRNAAVQAALRTFVPDVEVIDSFAYDWVDDPFSKGAWMMHRPGHLTGGAAALRRPRGRLHFAGSDIALLSPGSIEGAMQSGATAARNVLSSLRVGCKL